MGSTALYAYTTLISVIICVPLALMAEGSTLVAGAEKAIAAVGATRFWGDLFAVGLLYHLYNQVGPKWASCTTYVTDVCVVNP